MVPLGAGGGTLVAPTRPRGWLQSEAGGQSAGWLVAVPFSPNLDLRPTPSRERKEHEALESTPTPSFLTSELISRNPQAPQSR